MLEELENAIKRDEHDEDLVEIIDSSNSAETKSKRGKNRNNRWRRKRSHVNSKLSPPQQQRRKLFQKDINAAMSKVFAALRAEKKAKAKKDKEDAELREEQRKAKQEEAVNKLRATNPADLEQLKARALLKKRARIIEKVLHVHFGISPSIVRSPPDLRDALQREEESQRRKSNDDNDHEIYGGGAASPQRSEFDSLPLPLQWQSTATVADYRRLVRLLVSLSRSEVWGGVLEFLDERSHRTASQLRALDDKLRHLEEIRSEIRELLDEFQKLSLRVADAARLKELGEQRVRKSLERDRATSSALASAEESDKTLDVVSVLDQSDAEAMAAATAEGREHSVPLGSSSQVWLGAMVTHDALGQVQTFSLPAELRNPATALKEEERVNNWMHSEPITRSNRAAAAATSDQQHKKEESASSSSPSIISVDDNDDEEDNDVLDPQPDGKTKIDDDGAEEEGDGMEMSHYLPKTRLKSGTPQDLPSFIGRAAKETGFFSRD